jgi:DNA polymerase-3 subunit epsilon
LRKNTENAFSRSGYHSDLRNIKSAIRPLSELENDMKSLSEFTTRKKIADFAGMILLIRMMKRFYFGKHKG